MKAYMGSGIVALANIIVGISALAFNKYPVNERTLSEMKRKYGYANKNKLIKANGFGFLMIGILWEVNSVIGVNYSIKARTIIFSFSIIIIILYLWLKHNFLVKGKIGEVKENEQDT